MHEQNAEENAASREFPLTSWTDLEVIRDTEVGLEEFLIRYRIPLFAFLTEKLSLDAELAEELVQSFLVERVLRAGFFEKVTTRHGEFRKILRASLKRHCIDYFRKRKREFPTSETVDLAESIEDLDEYQLDQPWAIAVFREALGRLRTQSDYWDLFEARVLRGLSYEELKPTIRCPHEASNRLMTAKRQFNRLVCNVLEEQQVESGPRLRNDIEFLKECLLSSNLMTAAIEESISTDPADSRTRSLLLDVTQFRVLDEERPEFDKPEELREVTEHFLSLQVIPYLKEENAITDSRMEIGLQRSDFTFADLFFGEMGDYEILSSVKAIFNNRAKRGIGYLPSKINAVIAYACIAAVLRRYPAKAQAITSMPSDKVAQGLAYFREQNWLPEALATHLAL